MAKLLTYIQILCVGEMVGVIALALGAWAPLSCGIVGVVVALFIHAAKMDGGDT
mgnify:CR=1 FL=1